MTEYIEREKVLEKGVPIDGFFSNMIAAWDVAHIPAADVAPLVHGRWQDVYMSSPSSFVGTCSVCEVSNSIPHPYNAHYCPNCGAKMDLRAGDE